MVGSDKAEPQLWHPTEHEALLFAHTGDLLLAALEDKVETIKKEIEQKLQIKWEAKLQGDWIGYLGFDWRRGTDVTNNQFVECRVRPGYVNRLLDEYGLQTCRAVSIPGPATRDEQVGGGQLDKERQNRYRRVVDKLKFMISGRPDMAFAIKEAARHVSRPVETDEVDVKRCLRYLKGTRDDVLRYTWKSNDTNALQILQVMADASWVSTLDRKAMTGEIICWHGFL